MPDHLRAVETETTPFDEFWHVWKVLDRNMQKGLCRLRFDAITSPEGFKTTMLDREGNRVPAHWKATPEDIVSGARAYKEACLRRDTKPEFVVTPAVFLNQGRWMDYE